MPSWIWPAPQVTVPVHGQVEQRARSSARGRDRHPVARRNDLGRAEDPEHHDGLVRRIVDLVAFVILRCQRLIDGQDRGGGLGQSHRRRAGAEPGSGWRVIGGGVRNGAAGTVTTTGAADGDAAGRARRRRRGARRRARPARSGTRRPASPPTDRRWPSSAAASPVAGNGAPTHGGFFWAGGGSGTAGKLSDTVAGAVTSMGTALPVPVKPVYSVPVAGPGVTVSVPVRRRRRHGEDVEGVEEPVVVAAALVEEKPAVSAVARHAVPPVGVKVSRLPGSG